MAGSIDRLIAAQHLPDDYAAVADAYWAPLARYVARHAQARRPLLVGINGAQGSGKSTMCLFLAALLGEQGLRVATLSLDDFYLTRAERLELAGTVHQLFVTRGVPGTHDTALIQSVLDDITAGRPATVPLFDKASDDRAQRTHHIDLPVDVILFEGWCVGASPQSDLALQSPVNALERDEDPAGLWRGAVNRRLQTDYAALFGQIDLLIMLAVDHFSAVAANRRLQEEKLARSDPTGPAIMDEPALQRFVAHYERITRHLLAEMPGRADVTFMIGRDQKPVALPPPLQE